MFPRYARQIERAAGRIGRGIISGMVGSARTDETAPLQSAKD